MLSPIVSIVIPTFNSASKIRKLLLSIQNQTYDRFEVIIVDDGSTDGLLDIVKHLIDVDIRFRYFFQENQGVASARNAGLKRSIGEYVCFIDADDTYESDFLELMVSKIMLQNSDVCYCGYNTIRDSIKKPKRFYFTSNDILRKYFLGRISIASSCWLIRHAFLLENNIIFPEEMSWGEDIVFFSNVIHNANKISFVNKYLCNYVISNDGTSLSSFDIAKIDKDYQCAQKITSIIGFNETDSEFIALWHYRLPALIIYRINEAIQRNIDTEIIRNYYQRYFKYINGKLYMNGLRTIKLLYIKRRIDKHILR